MTGTAQDIAAAVKALVPISVSIDGTTLTAKVYDTRVTDPKPPGVYFVSNVRIPNVAQRSEAAQPVSVLCKVAVTVGALSGVGVRDMAQAAADALEGVRPVAAGWETGPLQLRNTRGPDEDTDLTFTTGARVIYGLLEFDLTASRLP